MKAIRKRNAQRGFTLVEVIVVAIIVAALAGVAIPMYNNYVSNSRSNAAANAAGSVASWMGQCLSQVGTVAGVVAGQQTNGLAPINLTCTANGAVISTMALPPNILFTVSNIAGNGTVVAIHSEGGVAATYAY